MNRLTVEERAFRTRMYESLDDDTVRLVYADWLQDRDRLLPAGRLRWWVAARRKIRNAVVWTKIVSGRWTYRQTNKIGPEWVQRLFAIEIGRIVLEKYPLPVRGADAMSLAADVWSVIELYGLGLVHFDAVVPATERAEHHYEEAHKNLPNTIESRPIVSVVEYLTYLASKWPLFKDEVFRPGTSLAVTLDLLCFPGLEMTSWLTNAEGRSLMSSAANVVLRIPLPET